MWDTREQLPSTLCKEVRDSSLLVERSVPLSPLPPANDFSANCASAEHECSQHFYSQAVKSAADRDRFIKMHRDGTSEGFLTWQCDALNLVGLARVSLQFTFGHRLGLAQVEEGEPVPHRRLLRFGRRPLVATAQKKGKRKEKGGKKSSPLPVSSN